MVRSQQSLCFLITLLASTLAGCGQPQTAHPPQPAPDALAAGLGPSPAFTAPVNTPPVTSVPTPLPPPSSSTPPPLTFTQAFEHVRVDRAAGIVEFDGIVPLDCHDKDTPIVMLELICCSPDTREHESLVMTKAKPSAIHAALLLCGIEPGKPGMVDFQGQTLRFVPPEGPTLGIEFVYTGATGAEVKAKVSDWVKSMRDGRPFEPAGGFRFAGSRFVNRRDRETNTMREFYDADGAGTIIGLTTFGSETIGCATVLSPDEAITAAEWICNNAKVPPFRTPVRVRLSTRP